MFRDIVTMLLLYAAALQIMSMMTTTMMILRSVILHSCVVYLQRILTCTIWLQHLQLLT